MAMTLEKRLQIADAQAEDIAKLFRTMLRNAVTDAAWLTKNERDAADQRIAKQLNEECASGDTEHDHAHADDTLRDILKELGFTLTVEAYDKVSKWYA